MKLIVGLGNPGKKYAHTRHNIGFAILDAMAEKCGAEWKISKKLHGEITTCAIGEKKYLLLKPHTFMNNSGRAVVVALAEKKLTPDALIVVHDDADIPIGNWKLQENRGAAGHRGVQSIIDALKTKSFSRMRVGIQPADALKKISADALVLLKFSAAEKKVLATLLPSIIENI